MSPYREIRLAIFYRTKIFMLAGTFVYHFIIFQCDPESSLQCLETLVIPHFANGHLCYYANKLNRFNSGPGMDLSKLLGNLCKFTKLMA